MAKAKKRKAQQTVTMSLADFQKIERTIQRLLKRARAQGFVPASERRKGKAKSR